MNLRTLVGSGDRIVLVTLPFLLVGLLLNLAVPSLFDAGGPSAELRAASAAILIVGVTVWLWSVVLILTRVPQGRLITNGPFALVKHPLYTSVSLLVIPASGLLLNTWLGVMIGILMYFASRSFAPEEEAVCAETFGSDWDSYCKSVRMPWL